MVGTESACVRAGQWMYLFFNFNDRPQVDYWKVAEESREPNQYTIKIDGKDDISGGGAIAAVYLEKKDEIHVYFISVNPEDDTEHVVREACLTNASADGAPGEWSVKNMDLNKKFFEINPSSMLMAAVDSKGYPRVFYNQKQTKYVNFAEFNDIGSTGKKEWTTTRFTGTSS